MGGRILNNRYASTEKSVTMARGRLTPDPVCPGTSSRLGLGYSRGTRNQVFGPGEQTNRGGAVPVFMNGERKRVQNNVQEMPQRHCLVFGHNGWWSIAPRHNQQWRCRSEHRSSNLCCGCLRVVFPP